MGTCEAVCPNCGTKCAERRGHGGDHYHEPAGGQSIAVVLEASACLFGKWDGRPKFGKRT